MSVDFFDCENCGQSVCDCGDYWACEACGFQICKPCANEIVIDEDDLDEDAADSADENFNPCCPRCTKSVATETDLLGFALVKLGLSRDELLKQYQETDQ